VCVCVYSGEEQRHVHTYIQKHKHTHIAEKNSLNDSAIDLAVRAHNDDLLLFLTLALSEADTGSETTAAIQVMHCVRVRAYAGVRVSVCTHANTTRWMHT